MRIERDLGRLAGHFDVAVVGGGITGVSVAREAAGRGLRTLVVDKGDFGSGTSSATTKYIHGGIRYLETYEFRVVRESLRERRILGLAAPHLVDPTRFLMPAWRWSRPAAPVLAAGMLAYDALSFDKNRDSPESRRIPHPTWLSKKALLAAVPWLQPAHLQGAFAYYDTLNVHPERLLLAILQSAVQSGAVALNHVRVTGFTYVPDGDGVAVTGLELVDELTGERHVARASTVVNAGGPWMDLVLERLGRPLGVRVNRSKGVHLLTRALGGSDAVFARARNGRHVIVSPWQGRSFIGPTDTPLEGDPDQVGVDHDDVEMILETVNDTIGPPAARLTPADIEAVTVGIRPLIVEEGKDSYSTSRRHELYDHAPAGVRNLWSIGGGKWTTGRATGEEVVGALLRSEALQGVRTRRFDSATTAVYGAFAWAQDPQPYLDAAARSRPELGLPTEIRTHLARLYGTEHDRILDLVAADPALGRRISTREGRWDIAAQAVFAVTDESARRLGDVVHRRLVLGTLGGVTAEELERVAALVAPLLGWDEARTAAEVGTELAREARVAALRAGR